MITLLTDAYRILYENCKLICEEIDTLLLKDQGIIFDFKLCISDISVHLQLQDIKYEDINVSQELNANFLLNRGRKSISFYTKEEFLGIPQLITDSELINDLFLIPNCLPLFKIVLMQIASNAKKYMPDNGELSVTLVKKGDDIHMMFSNLGPHCSEEDIEHIFEEGIRGTQANNIAIGLGIGLSEIRKIVDIHSWLNMDCYVSSDNKKCLSINNSTYSEFCIELVYSQFNNKAPLPTLGEINNMAQMILIHNANDIADKLIRVSRCLYQKKQNREASNKLNTEANLFLDRIKFGHFLYNNKENVSDLLGNQCRMDISNVFKACITNLKNYYYPNLGKLDIEGTLFPIDTYSCMYYLLTGLLYCILSCYDSGDDIYVTLEDDTIVIEGFTCDVRLELNKQYKEKFDLYEKILSEFSYSIQYKNNIVKIVLS